MQFEVILAKQIFTCILYYIAFVCKYMYFFASNNIAKAMLINILLTWFQILEGSTQSALKKILNNAA
jgi:hypothetical protein